MEVLGPGLEEQEPFIFGVLGEEEVHEVKIEGK